MKADYLFKGSSLAHKYPKSFEQNQDYFLCIRVLFLAFSWTQKNPNYHMNAAHMQIVFHNVFLYQKLFM